MSTDPAAWSFETKQIHAGQSADTATGARALPIYQTTSYAFRDTDHAAALFGLAEPGNIYTRIMNPTQDAVEQRVAALEGGVGALLLASGQAAETFAILNLAEAGDHIVSSESLYGGTYNLFHYTLPKLGIEVSFVDPDDLDAWRAAVRPNTKAFFGETIAQPEDRHPRHRDRRGHRARGRRPADPRQHVATPYLIQPLKHGADIVVHSATKYLGGHGTAVAGVIVDGGTFDWAANAERFPQFSQPDPSYHGLVYTEALGPLAFIVKARIQLLRDLGAAVAPFNAFLVAQGLETLSLRIERHVQNAKADRGVARGERAGRVGQLLRPAELTVVRARSEVRTQGRRRGALVRDRWRPRGGQDGSSTHSSCSATSPTSATSGHWSSTRPPPRTRSSRRTSRRHPASRPGWCALRSGSKVCPT